MIELAQYRAIIGSFAPGRIRSSTQKLAVLTPPRLRPTLVCAAVISILLIIGGIEANPGPVHGASGGKDK